MANDSDALDRARVEHVAKLASLALTPDELDKFARELASIVTHVKALEGLDTADVPPTSHGDLGTSSLRADEPVKGLSREDALKAAPRHDHGGFAVPTFVES
ncbi:MAG: Asp-tRNA(Asn)/Glu-tRNA(Gln) amidotransferase subunit GatC [Polyangiaceae bacterium]